MDTTQIIPTAPYTSHHHMQPQIRLDRERDGDGPCSTVRAGGGAPVTERCGRRRGTGDREHVQTENWRLVGRRGRTDREGHPRRAAGDGAACRWRWLVGPGCRRRGGGRSEGRRRHRGRWGWSTGSVDGDQCYGSRRSGRGHAPGDLHRRRPLHHCCRSPAAGRRLQRRHACGGARSGFYLG
jgi:hypothetical protein